MFTIIKKLEFCYGHRLMDYDGLCSRPHGHNAVAEVEMCSPNLDETGMVIDFGEVDEVLSGFIDEKLDHQMLLRKDDPLVDALMSVNEPPFLMEDNPTAENIAKLILEEAVSRDLPVLSVKLWETPDACAEYRIEGAG